MTASISGVPIGDLHMDEADGLQSRGHLERMVVGAATSSTPFRTASAGRASISGLALPRGRSKRWGVTSHDARIGGSPDAPVPGWHYPVKS
jgi:hypothetical protein